MQSEFLLVLAGIISGSINAIAGGGAIVMLPALLLSGLSPVSAVATISLAVFPGNASAAFGYRKQLVSVPKYFLWLVIPSFIGAVIGASILINIDPKTFESIIPWLVLSAVLLLALQTKIHHMIVSQKQLTKTTSELAIPLLYLSVLVLAMYGGFFGVGVGLMLLAIFGFSKLKNNYQMSAVKNICTLAITFVATVYFLNKGLVDTEHGSILAIGSIIGGYSGARLSQKVSSHLVHNLSLIIGSVITVYLFVR